MFKITCSNSPSTPYISKSSPLILTVILCALKLASKQKIEIS
jgi:hypothetical protein